MTIYSWNMLFRNPDLDRAFAFVRDSRFDIFCLQEVPAAFLERLRSLPYQIVAALDTDRIERDSEHEIFCVILTPHRIISSHPIELPLETPRARTKLFRRFMWGLQKVARRGSIWADIDTPLGLVRVFDLHLTLSYPARIMREFELALEHRDATKPMIVCGDLNVLESPHITVLNWLLGGRIRDALAWRASRKAFQQAFARLGLQNPLRGGKTQKIAYSQLDHILVPESWRVIYKSVLPDRLGSDHNPILLEVA